MNEKTKNKLTDILIVGIISFVVVFILDKLFFILFPIIAGYFFSEVMISGFKKMYPVSGKVKKTLSVLMLLIFFGLVSLTIAIIFDKCLQSITLVGKSISENIENIESFFERIINFAEKTAENVLKRDMHSKVSEYILSVVSKFLDSLVGKIPSLITSIIDFVPKMFISLVIFVFSAYYFACDSDFFSGTIKISDSFKSKFVFYKKCAVNSAKKTISAYFYLFLLTFAELFIGFLIIGIKDSFSLAFIVSFVDMLPILGVGTVLVPWSFILLISGNTRIGIEILILWLIVFCARQITEPKIVGAKLGLHPVISLVSVIIGLYFFGIIGLIFVPLAVSVVFDCFKSKSEKYGTDKRAQNEKTVRKNS